MTTTTRRKSPKKKSAADISAPVALPAISTPEQVAKWLGTSVAALAQDRYLNRGLPYVKISGRIRYVSDEIAEYLKSNRHG